MADPTVTEEDLPHTYGRQAEFVRTVWVTQYGIERWAMLTLVGLKFGTPFLLFSHRFFQQWPLKRRKIATELYCMARLVAFAVLLYCAAPGSGWCSMRSWPAWLTAYLLGDLLLGLLGGIFLSRPGLYGRPVAATRSLLLALLSYWEINLAFATFYQVLGTVCSTAPDKPVADLTQLIYFSTITMTTIGFGDLHPCSSAGYWFSCGHAFIALVFATFVLSLLVSQAKLLTGPTQKQ